MTFNAGVRDGLARSHTYVLANPISCLGPRPGGDGAVTFVLPSQLHRLNPVGSWLLAVVLCPGDTAGEVAAWVKKRRGGSERVWFFMHAQTPADALRPWADAGFPTNQVDEASGWRQLESLLVPVIHDRAYADRIRK